MRTAKALKFKYSWIFLCILIVVLISGNAYSDSKYPIRLERIDRSQARYDTPENTLAAGISALLKKDLEWYYETLTKESAALEKKIFKDAGMDPRKSFEIVDESDKDFIINKMLYKNGVILVGKSISKDGSILIGPAVFIKENGLWKQTIEYNTDEELEQYEDVIAPEEILSSTIKIQPKTWNIDLYNWINENLATSRLAQLLAEKMTILTIIKDMKDKEGNSYNTNDIIFDSIRLNGIVPPQTWKVMGMEKTAIVQDSELNEKLKLKRGFDEWNRNESFIKNTRMPFILVRFNMFKSMGTLTEMKPHNKYDIEITGELNSENNENEKVFKGTAKIKLMGIRKSDTKGLKDSILPEAEHTLQNWWNQEPGLDDRWKSLRHDKPDKYNDSERNSKGHRYP